MIFSYPVYPVHPCLNLPPIALIAIEAFNKFAVSTFRPSCLCGKSLIDEQEHVFTPRHTYITAPLLTGRAFACTDERAAADLGNDARARA